MVVVICFAVLGTIIKYNPFVDSLVKGLYIYNEMTIIALVGHLFWFTNYVEFYNSMYYYGWSFVVIVLVNICINFFFVTYLTGRDIYWELKKRCHKYMLKRARKTVNEVHVVPTKAILPAIQEDQEESLEENPAHAPIVSDRSPQSS